jgi:hypothetical protein
VLPLLLLVMLVTAAVLATASATADTGIGISQVAGVRSLLPIDWQARYRELQRKHAHLLRYVHRVKLERARLRTSLRWALQRGPTDVPWVNEAFCIHHYESTDWHQRGHHFGGMQFNPGTFHSVGGRGNPAAAHPMEQLYRAFLVWSRDGGSWREWTTAPLCGL